MNTSRETGAVRRWMTLASLAALILSSCTEDTVPRRPTLRKGGTLEVNLARGEYPAGALSLDPQTAYDFDGFAIFRCCLVRTLLSYTGRPTALGGSELHPDLAASLPDVSADNLTWTFRLKRDLRYGPPFTDTEIVAADIARALERTARVGAYTNYYTVIEGFSEVMNGESETISGLETPDDHTLVVHLTEPTGELGYRFSLPAAGPIPPSPTGGPLGAAEGHEDYGPFIVSSGPYAVEGSEQLDFGRTADEQSPSSGFRPDESLTLVRNTAWRAASDRLRPAYPDRIEITMMEDPELASREVHEGAADIVLFGGPILPIPPDVIEAYRSDPNLSERIVVGSADSIIYSSMNLAVPPFDDIHVRKAVNYVVNKSRLMEIQGGPTTGKLATHIILDSMENNLLLDYDPYASPGGAGDLDRARNEMAQSRYDQDGDGVCDADACTGVRALNVGELPGVDTVGLADSISSDLEKLGITLDVRSLPGDEYFERLMDPRRHVALGITAGWSKDFPSADSHVTPLFSREGLDTCCNYSLVGATPEELQEWGYEATSVPNVEEKISECRPLLGDDGVRCWTELDQQLMEQVVPWVPLHLLNRVYIVSRRVAATSFDQFTTLPALDRIALSPKNSGSP